MSRNHPSTDNWKREVCRKVGEQIQFVQTRVGQTLHVPCARGHIVPVEIKKMMPPEAVTRKMLHEGWTIGSKPVCPKHSGGKRKCGTEAPPQPEDAAVVEAKAVEVPPGYVECKDGRVRFKGPGCATRGVTANKIIEALGQFGELTIQELSELVMVGTKATHRQMKTLFDEGRVARRLGEADRESHRPYIYSLPKPAPAAAPKPKDPPMPAIAATSPSVPQPTDEAKIARRLAHAMIEEQFDVDKGQYRNGFSDQKIATETGAALAFVTKRREEEFGPLKAPSEIEEERARLDAIEQRIATFEAETATTIEKWRADCAAHRQRLAALIARNGW